MLFIIFLMNGVAVKFIVRLLIILLCVEEPCGVFYRLLSSTRYLWVSQETGMKKAARRLDHGGSPHRDTFCALFPKSSSGVSNGTLSLYCPWDTLIIDGSNPNLLFALGPSPRHTSRLGEAPVGASSGASPQASALYEFMNKCKKIHVKCLMPENRK